MRFTHLDAAESAFFQRELEHVKATTYDVKYPTLRAREFIPVAGDAGPGAESVTYRQMDQRGRAKIVGNKPGDIPRVDVLGKEFTRPVRTIADAYGWDLFELRNAAMANRPLNTMRADAARRAIEEELDQVACFGSVEDGIVDGFLNSADVTATGVATPWNTPAAPDVILKDIGDALGRIVSDTNGIHRGNALLLPDVLYMHLSTTPRSSTSDTTILEFVRRSFPGIVTIEPWYRLATADAGDERVVLYERDPGILTQDITSEFEQLPVQEKGLEFIVNCVARTAGTKLYYPKAVQYLDAVAL